MIIFFNGDTLADEHQVEWVPENGPFPVPASAVFRIEHGNGRLPDVGALARCSALFFIKEHGVQEPPK
jgi:hypothetical protein